jgi:neuronal growth regulator 1
VTVPRKELSQALRYDMDLECHVEAYPPPQIKWIKDEFHLSNNKKYQISNFNTADEFTDSTLRITKIDEQKFGKYRCEAVNKLGRGEGEVELRESSSPVCPPACGQGHSSSNKNSLSNEIVAIYIMTSVLLLRA